MKGFKDFIMRGNVVDLAVAVVIGAAFGGVIASFVKDLLTPLIAAIGGKPDFSNLFFTLNGSRFQYGDFVNSILAFVLVSAAIYYLVVIPISRMRKPATAAEAPPVRKCPDCLSEIPAAARRCAHCGQPVASISSVSQVRGQPGS